MRRALRAYRGESGTRRLTPSDLQRDVLCVVEGSEPPSSRDSSNRGGGRLGKPMVGGSSPSGRAKNKRILGWKPTPKTPKGALDRAVALEGVELIRSSAKVQVLTPDDGTKTKTLAAWHLRLPISEHCAGNSSSMTPGSPR